MTPKERLNDLYRTVMLARGPVKVEHIDQLIELTKAVHRYDAQRVEPRSDQQPTDRGQAPDEQDIWEKHPEP